MSEATQILTNDAEGDHLVRVAGDGITKSIRITQDYWLIVRRDYSGGTKPVYIGKNLTHKAATDASTWYIWKYTWSGNDCPVTEGPLVGSWDGRDSLDWV